MLQAKLWLRRSAPLAGLAVYVSSACARRRFAGGRYISCGLFAGGVRAGVQVHRQTLQSPRCGARRTSFRLCVLLPNTGRGSSVLCCTFDRNLPGWFAP
jgi:hypothetical protein